MWDEVRSLNEQHGTTIFLTTQYLEEADELADRVGIISRGRLVAEGTPDELKRTVGTDVIVARVESLTDTTLEAVAVGPGGRRGGRRPRTRSWCTPTTVPPS